MSVRLRILFWALLVLSFAGLTWRSYRTGDTIVGPIGMGNTIEFVSWKGKGAMIVGFGTVSSGGVHHSTTPMRPEMEDFIDPLVQLGIRKVVSKAGASGIVFCWPSFLPVVLLFLFMEGTWWLRRRRKLKVDAAPDAGIACSHECQRNSQR